MTGMLFVKAFPYESGCSLKVSKGWFLVKPTLLDLLHTTHTIRDVLHEKFGRNCLKCSLNFKELMRYWPATGWPTCCCITTQPVVGVPYRISVIWIFPFSAHDCQQIIFSVALLPFILDMERLARWYWWCTERWNQNSCGRYISCPHTLNLHMICIVTYCWLYTNIPRETKFGGADGWWQAKRF